MAKGIKKGRNGKPLKKSDKTSLVTREYTINFGKVLRGGYVITHFPLRSILTN
jgi:hypothetical protein